jgi:hypothetical protein
VPAEEYSIHTKQVCRTEFVLSLLFHFLIFFFFFFFSVYSFSHSFDR